jgi:hypothetical protein
MIALMQDAPNALLGKDAKNVVSPQSEAKRIDNFRKYRLLAHAQKLLIEAETKGRKGNVHRTRLCHNVRAFQAESIAIRIPRDASKTNAALAGVQTCGSIWACPICAKRIATKRGQEIAQIIDFMQEAGNVAIMVTNTARHGHQYTLKLFKGRFKAAHRRFVQSRRWRKLKAELGIIHSIKAVEGTWGIENGWHYHQHAILFLNADLLNAAEAEAFQAWIEAARSLWLDCLEKEGLDGIGEIAFDVQAEHDVKKHYLAKLGLEDETSNLDYELSAGHNKTGGGAKIWQILQKSWEGDALAGALYVEWVEAMSGDQWLTFSDGLRELCGVSEMSDEEAAIFEGVDEEARNETLLEMSDEDFMPVRKLGKLATLLELAAVTRDKKKVIDFLVDLYDLWFKSYQAEENRKIENQYRALDEKLANLRKFWNQSGKHPPEDSEFWELARRHKELKQRLGIR